MARSLSWLDHIVPIARTVQESARSHYGRKELQRPFELQARRSTADGRASQYLHRSGTPGQAGGSE